MSVLSPFFELFSGLVRKHLVFWTGNMGRMRTVPDRRPVSAHNHEGDGADQCTGRVSSEVNPLSLTARHEHLMQLIECTENQAPKQYEHHYTRSGEREKRAQHSCREKTEDAEEDQVPG